MKYFVWILTFILVSSCALQKRLYRPGFALLKPGTTVKTGRTNLSASSQTHRSHQTFIDPLNNTKAETDIALRSSEHLALTPKKLIHLPGRKAHSHLAKRLLYHRATQLSIIVTPNSVPKAGFRTFVYSLIFLGGALYSYFHLTGLVYVTAGLLIMAFVFCLVSLLTSASARKDKINNSQGWLTMSLITLLLDILEIAAIVIFFIALF